MFEIINYILADISKSIKKISVIFLISASFFVFYLYSIDERFTSYSKLLPIGASSSAGKNYNSLFQTLTGGYGASEPILYPFVYTEILNSYDFIDKIMDSKIPYDDQYLSIYEILAYKYDKDLSDKEDRMSLYNIFTENLYMPSFSTLTNMIELRIHFYSPESAQIINRNTIEGLIQSQNTYIKNKNLNEISYLETQIEDLSKTIDNLDNDLISFLNENKDISSPLLSVEFEKKKREIGIANSILSSTKLTYEDKKLKQLEEMNTLYIIENPSFAVDNSYPRKSYSLIVFSIAFVIVTIMRYYIKNYNYLRTKFV